MCGGVGLYIADTSALPMLELGFMPVVTTMPCPVTESVALLNLVQFVRFVKVVHGFLKVVTWICQVDKWSSLSFSLICQN